MCRRFSFAYTSVYQNLPALRLCIMSLMTSASLLLIILISFSLTRKLTYFIFNR